jgi:hypothetical protein
MRWEFDTTLRIAKLDAARRQLRTAIWLWFHDGDPVAAHTLAAAAYEIIHSISKSRDRTEPLLYDADIVRDEYRTDWIYHSRKHANFFKHADKDPNAVVEFKPQITEVFILFAIKGLELAGEQQTEYESAFVYWFMINRPEYLTERCRQEVAEKLPIEQLKNARRLEKSQFFNVMVNARQMALRARA